MAKVVKSPRSSRGGEDTIMSGGSYEYLFTKDIDELMSGHSDTLIESMSNRLAGLGYANDAASETEELLLIIRQVKNRLYARQKRLSNVWFAIEWWDSCDSDEDSVKEALLKYRESGAI
mgnify:CR=1 FL=1